MTKYAIQAAAIIAVAASVSSCTSVNKTMREPYSRVDFTKNDFTLSEQVSGQGTCTKVLGIDFYRWFHASNAGAVTGDNTGGMKISAASIPVIGGYLTDKSASYAVYDMLIKNPGYDVVFYPQFETQVRRPFLGIGFIYKKTTVKTMAKLGKLKP